MAIHCVELVYPIQAIGTTHKISCIGVVSYDGSHLHFKRMMELQQMAQSMWKDSQPRV